VRVFGLLFNAGTLTLTLSQRERGHDTETLSQREGELLAGRFVMGDRFRSIEFPSPNA